MNTKSRIAVLSAFIFCTLTAIAQPPDGQRPGGGQMMPYASRPAIGTISGLVQDSLSGMPLEYATIAVKLAQTDSIVAGGLTDAAGRFSIPEVRPGRYRLAVDYFGYATRPVENVMIGRESITPDVGTVFLIPAGISLDEVEISADKPFMQTLPDRKVYNVDKNLTASGGTLTEVLQNIPSLSVDIDGNVSLRGSGNFRLLVDGKPSGLTSSTLLEQIPASSIDRVEVITNPSAKFAPDGMTGILNIVLKKNKKPGLNGGTSLTLGTNNKYNAAADLSLRTQKVNLFGNYSFRDDERWGEGSSDRLTVFNDSAGRLIQSEESEMNMRSHLLRAGIDYNLNSKNTISASGTFSTRGRDRFENIRYEEYAFDSLFSRLYYRDSDDKSSDKNVDADLAYSRSFANPRQTLDISLRYSREWEEDSGDYTQNEYELSGNPKPEPPILERNISNEIHTQSTIQADYVHPVNENITIETGYQSIIRTADDDFRFEAFDYADGMYRTDSLRNNRFKYNEQVHAAYGTYGQTIGNFSFQAGLRVEQAFTTSELLETNEVFENDYFSLYPSAFLTQKLPKEQEIQLNYSRRINRPRERQLNPFTDYSDPLNLRRGNPFLRPEYIHSIEAGYSKRWDKLTVSSSVYFRRVTDVIQRYKTVDTTGVSLTTYENLTKASDLGVELIVYLQLFPWWNINASGNFYRTQVDGSNVEGELTNNGVSGFLRGASTTKLWKGAEVQISGRFMAPRVIPQGQISAIWGIDGALKQTFLKNKASASIRVSDIFNTFRFQFDTEGEGFTQSSYRKRESRIGYFALSYRFGQQERQKRRNGRGNGDEGDMGGGVEID